jgi:2-desacetyl-2-hydroxyethyl bacteriochlorophyllide A dehydrogenase
MQALVFRGERQIEIEEVQTATPGENELLIEVAYCGICGSDVSGYLGHSPRRNRSIPLVMGHEFSGRVVAAGAGVKDPAIVGQRVAVQPISSCGRCHACRAGQRQICPNMSLIGIERAGAFAPYVTVPADRAFVLPDYLADKDAALAETLAVEVHLFRRQAASLLRSVLVLGAGAQGMLAVQLAAKVGVETIIVTDVVPERLTAALGMGATHTLNAKETDVPKAVMELTFGWGAELAIETTGVPAARVSGANSLAPGGTLGLVGLGDGVTTLNVLPIVAKELNVRGSYSYNDDDFQRSLELLASGAIRTDDMVTILPLTAGPAAFVDLVEHPSGSVKVLLDLAGSR